MNARKWTTVFLFLGAYSPLFLILVVKDFDFECFQLNNPLLSWSLVVLSVVSVLVLVYIVRGQRSTSYFVKVSNLEVNSDAYLNYTIPYIISFFGVDTQNYSELAALAVFLVLLGFISVNAKVVFTNPVMAIMGYRIYTCTTVHGEQVKSNVVIFSKNDLSEQDQVDLKLLSKNTYLEIS